MQADRRYVYLLGSLLFLRGTKCLFIGIETQLDRLFIMKINLWPFRLKSGALAGAFYLWQTDASARSIAMYLNSQLESSANALNKKYAVTIAETQTLVRENSFKHDWFTHNVPYWMEVFDRCGLRDRPISILEIGSFEGLSACFLLRQLPLAHLTCVDTWEGSDEHAGFNEMASVEDAFDKNVAPWSNRVTKYKGYSFKYFASLSEREKYDFIYIDGSHRAEDVMVDAIRGFMQLKVGGVMIFDDYLWRYYPKHVENPATAINGFLCMIAGRYRLVMVYYQLALIRTA